MVQLQTGRSTELFINSKFTLSTSEESFFARSVGKKKSKGTHLEI